jgi:hypothetical protein
MHRSHSDSTRHITLRGFGEAETFWTMHVYQGGNSQSWRTMNRAWRERGIQGDWEIMGTYGMWIVTLLFESSPFILQMFN